MKIKVDLEENELVDFVVNESKIDIQMYIDVEKECIDSSEDEQWIQEQSDKGKIIVFPCKEELYQYNEAMTDFLCEHDLSIPNKMKAKQYLAENGILQNFYDFYECKIAEKLLDWSQKNQIEFIR